jgi:hypothetical protein
MKPLSKILLTFFLVFFIVLLVFPEIIMAQPTGLINHNPVDPNKYKPNLQMKIGSGEIAFDPIICDKGICSIPWIGQYVEAIYQYGIGLAAILATVMIMVGGFLWLTSAGSPDRVSKAKEFITSALTGLVLALFSYMILYTVNPQLVNLRPVQVPEIKEEEEKHTCCVCHSTTSGPDYYCYEGLDEEACYAKEGGSIDKCTVGGKACKETNLCLSENAEIVAPELLAKGKPCREDPECIEGVCVRGGRVIGDVCGPADDGELCTLRAGDDDPDIECRGNLICYTYANPDRCSRPKDNGAACYRPEECASGWCHPSVIFTDECRDFPVQMR